MKNLIYVIPYLLGFLFINIMPDKIFLIIPILYLISFLMFKDMYKKKIIRINIILINIFIFITLMQVENYVYVIILGCFPIFSILMYIIDSVYIILKNRKNKIYIFIKDMIIMLLFIKYFLISYLYLLTKIVEKLGYN